MQYFLLLSEKIIENSEDLFSDKFLLAETSFDNVYPKQGFTVFEKIINSGEHVDEIEILNEEGKNIEVEEFIKVLDDHDFRS